MGDSLARAEVEPLLRGRFGRDYLFVPSCPSTQRLLPAGAAEGAVAVTDHQTEGRGRRGDVWEDEPGTSILCSVVLRPGVPAERLPELTPLAARACAEALEAAVGLVPAVKEPNDVLLGERKVAGILGEAGEGRVVLGLGLNVNQTEAQLPLRTRLPVTSLRVELGRPVERAPLLAELLLRLERAYETWLRAGAPAR